MYKLFGAGWGQKGVGRGSLSNQLLNKLGRHSEKEEEEIMRQMKYLEGCLGET